MPIVSFSTLATGARQLVVQRGVGDDRVLGGQLVMVDAIDDGQVDALGRRRDQDFLGAGSRDAAGRLLAVGEEAGAFQRDIDRRCSPCGSLAGSRSAVTWIRLPSMIRSLPSARTSPGKAPWTRVALEQQGVGLGVGEVVDRDQLEPAVRLLEDGAGDEAADPPEAVDRNSGRHVIDLLELSAPQDVRHDRLGGEAEALEQIARPAPRRRTGRGRY